MEAEIRVHEECYHFVLCMSPRLLHEGAQTMGVINLSSFLIFCLAKWKVRYLGRVLKLNGNGHNSRNTTNAHSNLFRQIPPLGATINFVLLTRAALGGKYYPLLFFASNSKTAKDIDVKLPIPYHASIWHNLWKFGRNVTVVFLRKLRFCDVTTRHCWARTAVCLKDRQNLDFRAKSTKFKVYIYN